MATKTLGPCSTPPGAQGGLGGETPKVIPPKSIPDPLGYVQK
jgi:hypothetical protein